MFTLQEHPSFSSHPPLPEVGGGGRFLKNLHLRIINKGIATKAHYLSTPGAHSGNSPWKLSPCIVIVEYEIIS
jgi:hypothetical protein